MRIKTFETISNHIRNTMKISELFKHKSKTISIELNRKIPDNLDLLTTDFCSVTWFYNKDPQGDVAFGISRQLLKNGRNVLLHLPGRYLDKNRLDLILEKAKNSNIQNILALQGNVDQKLDSIEKTDFLFASDLVRYIRGKYDDYFCVGVTANPNQSDFEYLRQKIEAGADFIVTQFTFSLDNLNLFLQKCREENLKIPPIIVGLLTYTTKQSLVNTAKFCHVDLSDDIQKKIDENPGNIEKICVKTTSEMIIKLNESFHPNLKGFHLFCVKNPEQALNIFQMANLIEDSVL